jgi:hypothetical protein
VKGWKRPICIRSGGRAALGAKKEGNELVHWLSSKSASLCPRKAKLVLASARGTKKRKMSRRSLYRVNERCGRIKSYRGPPAASSQLTMRAASMCTKTYTNPRLKTFPAETDALFRRFPHLKLFLKPQSRSIIAPSHKQDTYFLRGKRLVYTFTTASRKIYWKGLWPAATLDWPGYFGVLLWKCLWFVVALMIFPVKRKMNTGVLVYNIFFVAVENATSIILLLIEYPLINKMKEIASWWKHGLVFEFWRVIIITRVEQYSQR